MARTTFSELWIKPAHETRLDGEKEIHAWCVNLTEAAQRAETLLQTLSPDERERASRFYFQKDREHFIAARGILRVILGSYLQLEPRELRFDYSRYGKPSLAAGSGCDTLHFNLSHSGEWAVMAFSRSSEIGVDIEYTRQDMAHLETAERFFSKREVEALRATAPGLLREAFFNCWTRKEAYVKARGEGLSHPLSDFSVSLKSEAVVSLLEIDVDHAQSSQWSLLNLPAPPDYAAALAVEMKNCELKLWCFERAATRPYAVAANSASQTSERHL